MAFSVAELYALVILVMPGFISFQIVRRAVFNSSKISQSDTIIWSLIFSIVNLSLFKVIVGFDSVESLQVQLFINYNIFTILVISVVVGLLFYIYRLYDRTQINDDPWNSLMKNARFEKDRVITIFTREQKEIRGYLSSSGGVKGEKDIIIRKPTEIIRNKKGIPISQIPLGKTMLVKENDIFRLSFEDAINIK